MERGDSQSVCLSNYSWRRLSLKLLFGVLRKGKNGFKIEEEKLKEMQILLSGSFECVAWRLQKRVTRISSVE